jgi:hypothetical protein
MRSLNFNRFSKLETLKLHDLGLNSESLKLLEKSFPGSLKEIEICQNNIGNSDDDHSELTIGNGVGSLVSILQNLPNLEKLELPYCKVK